MPKKFFWRPPPPPYLRVWMTGPPPYLWVWMTGPPPLSQGLDDPPPPPYLKVWIRHCLGCQESNPGEPEFFQQSENKTCTTSGSEINFLMWAPTGEQV